MRRYAAGVCGSIFKDPSLIKCGTTAWGGQNLGGVEHQADNRKTTEHTACSDLCLYLTPAVRHIK